MKTTCNKRNILAAVVLAVMSWSMTVIMLDGCGKKASPKPPGGNKPPKVEDLSYSIGNNMLKLSWTVPKTHDKAKSPAIGFSIYRSKQSLLEMDCRNCPVFFKQIGDVPVRGKTRPMVFTHTIEPGYRYIYKVKAYDDRGVAGKGSNEVEFKY